MGIYKYTYRSQVTDEYSINALKQFFDVLLNEKTGAVMYNCVAGKDRTGVATAILLSALGVDKETIIYDYLLTNDYIASHVKSVMTSAATETDDEALLEQLRYYLSVDISYIETMFSTIDSKYGSMDKFLEQAMGLTPEKIVCFAKQISEISEESN